MFEYKLQIACLIIILYFVANYVKESLNLKLVCSPLFDAVLYIAPWAVVLDGLTAWTVNHMDIVPLPVNFILHGLFFVLMNTMTVVIFLYMFNQTTGINNKKMLLLLMVPGAISLVLILVFMNKLYFVHGETTNYSMGMPVYACFVSLFLHFLIILGIILVHHRTIEKRKKFSIIIYMIITVSLLLVQVIFPEVLITALVPTFSIISLYMNFEDPSLRRIRTYNSDIVDGFATLVENRDNNTGGHIKRTKEYVRIMLNVLWNTPEYHPVVTKDYVRNVLNAAPMHDIGKIATPDYILQKPGKLTDEEYSIMREHAATGGDIILKTFEDIDDPEYKTIAYEVARHHHEKWNGKGYPDGLKGEDIPLHARIMAIADVFDAVSSRRCYRDAMPLETCFKIIEEGAGTDFDPKLVPLFLGAKNKIIAYYNISKKKDNDLA